MTPDEAGAVAPALGPALVTGAGRGIGRAVALCLARNGADLAVCALEMDELESLASEVRLLGRRVYVAPVDVADADELLAFVDGARQAIGAPEVVVSNAGTILLPDDVDHVDAELWDRTVDVNARAAYLLAGRTVPEMRQRGRGRFIAVASTAGLRGLPQRLAYVSSKHALVGLVRSLAAELRHTDAGVTVNAVCPGAVRTRLTQGSRPDDARDGWHDPDDVAASVAWLASTDAAHVHGAVLELDDRS